MPEISIYRTESGVIEVHLGQDTVWLNQAQMVALFGRDQSVISRHVGNIFKEDELMRKGNMQKMHIANSDKPLEFFNLDVIISVGYRVKSVQGTRFRQWATRTLREHLTQGYTLNRQRLEANARGAVGRNTGFRLTALAQTAS
ncbi:MAG: virulence RhuM family protein [Desulfomicrobium sp.]|nr:virulence RhuM family protein [Pseudomonadota bacterium]MBV1713812.1 virulence RhuM family protein [Desulfomicrobium sp.]MBU4572347.1 virulence RhuM family protein [Pseudomonadota bacterium]MBU4594326.1 virulence RhuM family protein [Pseudomonadota bacterium]MBV1719494.1 virulence RhuM family protein [Desulfomicrobium sp.]